MIERLYRLILISQAPGTGGHYRRDVYVVLADSAEQAAEILRQESPAAFAYGATVEKAEQIPGRTVHLQSGRIKLDRVDRQRRLENGLGIKDA
jgi:hypothetical protein